MLTKTQKWLISILAVILLVCMATVMVGCDQTPDDGEGGDTLVAPVISLNDETGKISWSAVENATRYIIYEDDVQITTVTATSYVIEQTVEGSYVYTVAAYSADLGTSAKSNAVTYTVTPVVEEHEHEYTKYESMGDTQHLKSCKDDDSSVLEDHKLVYDLSTDTQHVKSCELCDYSKAEDHVYDDDDDTTCNLCGYERTLEDDGGDEPEHVHDWKYVDEGESGHSVYCNNEGCPDEQNVLQDHVWDSDSDTLCDLCGYTRVSANPDQTVYGVGLDPVTATIPTGSAKLIARLGSGVVSGGVYKLSLTSVGNAFGKCNVTISVNDEIIGMYKNGVSYTADEKLGDIILWNVNPSTPIHITQDGDTAFDVEISLVKLSAEGNYYIEADEVLSYNYDSDTGADVDLTVEFGNSVVNGKPYTLKVVAVGGSDTDSITLSYYENGELKTATLSANGTKSVEFTVDTSYSLNLTYSSSSALSSISLTLTRITLPGETQSNPIIKDTIAGEHYAEDLQEAYFRLPKVKRDSNDSEGIGNPTDKYIISFDSDHVFVWIIDLLSGNKESVQNGQELSTNSNPSLTSTAGYNYFYVEAEYGYECKFTLTLDEEAPVYELRVGETVYAEMPNDGVLVEFKLIGVEPGQYTISIHMPVEKLTLTLGGQVYEFADNITSLPLTIDDEESLFMAFGGKEEYGLTLHVTLEKYKDPNEEGDEDIDSFPTLGHGAANAAKFTASGDSNYLALIKFKLVDVPAGTYTLALDYASYEDMRTIYVVVGDITVYLCGSDGYKGDQVIDIPEGATVLEFYAEGVGDGQRISYTLYLLADGESKDDGNGAGGTETSATINFENFGSGYGYVAFDVSSLQYGEYSISLETTDMFHTYYLAYSIDGEGEINLDLSNNFTATGIIISSDTLYLNAMGDWDTLIITLVKTGDLPGGGGNEFNGDHSGTSLTKNGFVVGYSDDHAVLDVSGLQAGEYSVSIYFDGFALEEPIYILYFDLENQIEISGNPTANGTITIPAGATKLYIYSEAFGGKYVDITLELIGGGSGSGEGEGDSDVAGNSYDNPIDCSSATGTFTTDLQEAWFRLPGTYMFGAEFTITFADGLTVELDYGYYKETLKSGGAIEIHWLDGAMVHVVSTNGTPISFTITEGAPEGGEDEEGTLSASQSVTVDIPEDTFVMVVLGASVSDSKEYRISISGNIPDDVTVWVFNSEWAAMQIGEEGDYAICTLVIDYDFGYSVGDLYEIICIRASSALTNITITLEEL